MTSVRGSTTITALNESSHSFSYRIVGSGAARDRGQCAAGNQNANREPDTSSPA